MEDRLPQVMVALQKSLEINPAVNGKVDVKRADDGNILVVVTNAFGKQEMPVSIDDVLAWYDQQRSLFCA